MGHRDDYEFFDPRQVKDPDESPSADAERDGDAGERIVDVAPVPDLSLRPDHPLKPAPDVVLSAREIKAPDLVYQQISGEREMTPMPEAWIALSGGALMTLSTFLTWTHADVGDVRVAADALSLGLLGQLILVAGLVTSLLGLLGIFFRVGRVAVFGWVTGLLAAATAGHEAPKLFRGDYVVHSGSLSGPSEGLGVGLVILILGVLITLFAALWASSTRVGR